MAIGTIADIKTLLGISVSTYDDVLTLLLNAAEARLKKFTGRIFEVDDYTETYDGSDLYSGRVSTLIFNLYLDNWPINTVSSLAQNGTTIIAAVAYSDTGYRIYGTEEEDGRIHYTGGFVRGLKNIAITYNGGYSSDDMPEDLKMSLYQLVSQIYQTRLSQGMTEMEQGLYRIKMIEELSKAALPAGVKRTWLDYKRTIIL